MSVRGLLIIVIAGWMVFAARLQADEAVYVLQANPFNKPLIEEVVETKAVAKPEPSLIRLGLRATMVGKEESFANVGGMIVGIGEEIEGYKLVSVENEKAVFSKDGDSITLTLDSESNHEEQD